MLSSIRLACIDIMSELKNTIWNEEYRIMIKENFEKMKKRGNREDVSYRPATEEEARRCRNAEKMKSWSLPAEGIGIAIGIAVTAYGFLSLESIYVGIAGAVITLIAIITFIYYFIDAKPSKSYEVIEAECLSISSLNKRRYVNAWVEKDQIYVKKYRWCSAFHLYTNYPVLLVKGDRGEGKKPDYFAIGLGDDPLTR